MQRGGEPESDNRPLIVLLGASNLTRGLPAAVAAASQRLGGGPAEILVAAGHGRSYGTWSHLLARGLPGVVGCGLWDELDRLTADASSPARLNPRLALLTDVGNDVGYGHAPETIADWAEQCAARLAAAGFTGVLSRLPLASLGGLPTWRLRLAARLLFPAQRLSPAELLTRAGQLEELLDGVAQRHGFVRAGLGERWYGPDGIHIWRWRLAAAWAALLGSGSDVRDSEMLPPPSAHLGDRWRLTVTMPERYRLIGAERRGRGRCLLRDRSTVRVF